VSLLNAWVAPYEAIVAVDTDGAVGDGSRIATSKLLAIPHLNTVLALRGQMAFLTFLHAQCLTSCFECFDDLNDAMPDLLAAAEQIPEELLVRGAVVGNELVVVGWSERQSRMLGRQFVKRGAMPEFSAKDCELHISPWDGDSMATLPRTAKAVEQLAGAQVRWMRQSFPNAACGGKLILAHVTKKGISMVHRLTFPVAEAA
jgi:hypothetical protein